MKRPLACFALAALALLTAAGCGGNAETQGSGAGGNGSGSGSGGDGESCKLDPPGNQFTFHVHNGTTSALRLTFGCGGTLPLKLVTPHGTLDAGPGPVNYCEFTCEVVYSGMSGFACSDCGPGGGADLGPGVTADITWDRRVYESSTVPDGCGKNGTDGQQCALGLAVAATTSQQGTLTVCTDTGGIGGYCDPASEQAVPFTVDTTGTSATIEIN